MSHIKMTRIMALHVSLLISGNILQTRPIKIFSATCISFDAVSKSIITACNKNDVSLVI